MKAPKDRPAGQSQEPTGTRRTTVIPVEVWLGDGDNPGLVDMPLEDRVQLLAEAREDKGPMWGPPEWTKEDERRWTSNSR